MTKEEIISGLQFTIDMFLFDGNTGEILTEPRNDMDKTTIDACRGAIELLKRSENPTSSDLSSGTRKNSKKLEKNIGELDCISRQAINGYIDYILSHGMGKKKSFDYIKKFVANLPPATPQEPRKGEWQLTDDEMFVYCPFCRQTDYTRPIDASWKYCPECGARLD